jgi:hypothetical protein
MSRYYILIESTGEQLALDSTSSVSLKLSGMVSSFPIETGETVSDNYVNSNATISFKGRISTAKSASGRSKKTPSEYIRTLQDLKERREVFTIYHISEAVRAQNCLFTSLSFTQSKSNGVTGTRDSSVEVSFTAKQVRFASVADIKTVPQPSSYDAQSEKATGSSLTVEPKELPIDVEQLKAAVAEHKKEIEGLN